MKVKHAACEKRNMNVISYEITVEQSDTFLQLKEEIEKLEDVEYLVVKTPINSKEFLWGMSELGFTYIETQIILLLKKDKYAAPKEWIRFARHVSTKLAGESDLDRIRSEILGDVFDTDRFALDKVFTKEQSANRYKNWTNDLLTVGAYIVELLVKDKSAGFFVIPPSKEGEIGNAGLAGIYESYKGKGFGSMLIMKMVDHLLEKGHSGVYTGVSSNNQDILNIHLMLGFNIKSMNYVYVKHLER